MFDPGLRRRGPRAGRVPKRSGPVPLVRRCAFGVRSASRATDEREAMSSWAWSDRLAGDRVDVAERERSNGSGIDGIALKDSAPVECQQARERGREGVRAREGKSETLTTFPGREGVRRAFARPVERIPSSSVARVRALPNDLRTGCNTKHYRVRASERGSRSGKVAIQAPNRSCQPTSSSLSSSINLSVSCPMPPTMPLTTPASSSALFLLLTSALSPSIRER